MSEFVMLYRRSEEISRQAMGTPEKFQKSMKQWRDWMKGLEAKGQLKSVGLPLEDSGRVVGGKKKTITDGPYAETKDVIGGYSIIVAKDLDEAAKIASGCPVLEGGGAVEVRPTRQISL